MSETEMKDPLWIGPIEDVQEGHIAFLIHKSNPTNDYESYELRDTPPYTNQSHKPQLFGWCGSYNNLSTNGCGLVKVIRVAKNSRVLVQQIKGDELKVALEELGYPELA